ncbi:exo-alpha-sialidase [Membranicola marinus]|uniref:Exo-alpha-sialidase n=1 Tax=Membranihabitans marinus TaxID=1227546 RepID=A0A953L9R3_9BACT|nr:exo-alpha-sialidase [Membranihabitans marinus]MBY5957898.1 exo-alpha-sialidase [Membranihabitans marinus]
MNRTNSTADLKVFLFFGLILSSSLLIWSSCEDLPSEHRETGFDTEVVISDPDAEAVGPYFTSDVKGTPILVWSEKCKGEAETGYVMKFSKFSKEGGGFQQPREVSSSRGCTTTSESMGKIAFKKDGTMIALYSRRSPTPENRFSGALYYTQSFDEGRTWTPEKYLHVGDTTRGLSRSFFDVATLPDGEVGAIWLDSRRTEQRGDGSTLFFAKTKGKQGFLTDQPVGYNTCECCRTELFVSADGHIHALYRDIWQDSIRDISHLVSRDGGRTFSEPERISSDNWVIYGCPHTGPSVCERRGGIDIVWFTGAGLPGLYTTRFDKREQTYTPKKLLTKKGRHPQILASGDDHVVYLWEEAEEENELVGHLNHSAPKATISLNSFSESKSVIKAQVWKNGHPVREHWVSHPDRFAELPVGIYLPDGSIGVAWIQKEPRGSTSIRYRRIKG